MSTTTQVPLRQGEWSFGTIPKHWRAAPLKHLCKRFSLYGANIAAEDYQPEGARFIRTSDIREDGTLEDGGVFLPAQLVTDYILAEGDFLISRSGTVGRAYVYRAAHGMCAYAGYLVRYVLRDPETPRWLFYITKSSSFQQWLGASAIEATIGNVNGEKYANLLVPVPPLSAQRAIADYLDRETARLDGLVSAKERMLRLLAEKHQALITRAVTRGLDPRAPLRDSGIPWLGEIPAHWQLIPLRFLVEFSGGSTPDTGKAELWDGDIPWVSPKDMKQDEIGDAEDHVTALALSSSALRLVEPVAVLIVVRGMILAHSFPTAVTTRPVTINQDMKALRCRASLEPRFLRDFLRGLAAQLVSIAEESAHGTRKLESEVLERFEVCVPPLEEQRAIIAHIAAETTKLAALCSATECTVALLSERRAALIAAAVTGHLKIPRAA